MVATLLSASTRRKGNWKDHPDDQLIILPHIDVLPKEYSEGDHGCVPRKYQATIIPRSITRGG